MAAMNAVRHILVKIHRIGSRKWLLIYTQKCFVPPPLFKTRCRRHPVFGSAVREWVRESMRPENLLNAISKKIMKVTSLSFGHKCIWVHVLIRYWAQKVKGEATAGDHQKPGEYNVFVTVWGNFTAITSRM